MHRAQSRGRSTTRRSTGSSRRRGSSIPDDLPGSPPKRSRRTVDTSSSSSSSSSHPEQFFDSGTAMMSPPPPTYPSPVEPQSQQPQQPELPPPPESDQSPVDLPPVASTVPELLYLEGCTPADVETCFVGEEVALFVWKNETYWRIQAEGPDGAQDMYRLVAIEPDERLALLTHLEDQAEARLEAENRMLAEEDDEYIVDRPGDPGYRNWVRRVLKPRVRGSRRLSAEAPPEESKGSFWWMSDKWRENYRKDNDLGSVVKNQISVSIRSVGECCWRAGELTTPGRSQSSGTGLLEEKHQIRDGWAHRFQAQGLRY